MDAFTSVCVKKCPGSGGSGGGGRFMEPAGKVVEAKEREGEGGIGGRNCARGLEGAEEEEEVIVEECAEGTASRRER